MDSAEEIPTVTVDVEDDGNVKGDSLEHDQMKNTHQSALVTAVAVADDKSLMELEFLSCQENSNSEESNSLNPVYVCDQNSEDDTDDESKLELLSQQRLKRCIASLSKVITPPKSCLKKSTRILSQSSNINGEADDTKAVIRCYYCNSQINASDYRRHMILSGNLHGANLVPFINFPRNTCRICGIKTDLQSLTAHVIQCFKNRPEAKLHAEYPSVSNARREKGKISFSRIVRVKTIPLVSPKLLVTRSGVKEVQPQRSNQRWGKPGFSKTGSKNGGPQRTRTRHSPNILGRGRSNTTKCIISTETNVTCDHLEESTSRKSRVPKETQTKDESDDLPFNHSLTIASATQKVTQTQNETNGALLALKPVKAKPTETLSEDGTAVPVIMEEPTFSSQSAFTTKGVFEAELIKRFELKDLRIVLTDIYGPITKLSSQVIEKKNISLQQTKRAAIIDDLGHNDAVQAHQTMKRVKLEIDTDNVYLNAETPIKLIPPSREINLGERIRKELEKKQNSAISSAENSTNSLHRTTGRPVWCGVWCGQNNTICSSAIISHCDSLNTKRN